VTVSAAPRSGRFPTLAKYDVLDELGHGGMATVYRAHDRRLGRDVAVKVIHPHLRDSREVAHRFAVEAQAVAKLRHPNIVEVFDVSGEDEPEQYLVVELLRGLTLRKLLQTSGAIPPEVAAAIGVELLSAVAHAHAAGVIHRDIKPENVMIEHHAAAAARAPGESTDLLPRASGRASPAEQPGDRALVKLTDFGIAKLLDGHGMTSTGQVLGSPAHMAPEQIEGGDVDGRADVFGIGVLLYECMVGHLPFEGNNPAQVLRRVLEGIYPNAERERPLVGKTWSAILDRALARKATDRFPDASAMRDAIAEELKRLRVVSPRSALEAWCDDPEGFSASHSKQMIETLCDLAAAARKRGDALTSAGDYNRALAYAPDDPALLKIVTRLHRSEANRRLARRVAPMALAVVAMGALAFFVTRAIRPSIKADPLLTGTSPEGSALTLGATGATLPSASALPPASSSGAGSASASVAGAGSARLAPTVAGPLTARPPVVPLKPITRDIVVRSLQPRAGILLQVDDAPPVDVEEGKRITLDGQIHTLVFSCRKDLENTPVCEAPQRQSIPAGTAADAVDVRLRIKDALLHVRGDANRSYGIKEYPTIRVLVGEDTTIPLSQAAAVSITVVERGETDHTQAVRLHAGRRADVSFLSP
jgi:serine/threonine protein kinase